MIALHIFGHNVAAYRSRCTKKDQNYTQFNPTEAKQDADCQEYNRKGDRFDQRGGQRIPQLPHEAVIVLARAPSVAVISI